jgi:hypothetical protein
MATNALTDCKLYVAQFDLSGDMNALSLSYAADPLDATTFGQTTRIHKAGIKSIVAQHEGLWNADGTDQADDVLFSRIGTQEVPVTICPTTGADGEAAYLFRALHSSYSPGGAVGQMLAFSVRAEGSDGAPLVRGQVLHPASAKTTTGTGTARQLGAVASTQTLYGSLHVIAASGTSPTLDVIVQSDNASNFPSATSRLTFAQKTAIGSEWKTADGAITDDWFRVSWTIGGTNPSFTFVVAVGIA